MPFIPAEKTAQVRVNQTLHGQSVTNTFYVTKNSEWGTADLIALANLFITWWNDALSDNLSVNLGLTSVSARSMEAEDAPGVEIAAPPASVGALPAQAMPGNTAFVVKHVTGLTGRNRRGRTFVAGITEVQAEGNLLAALSRDAILVAFGELRDALIGAGYVPVVASFYDGTALVPLGDGQIVRKPVPRSAALTTPIEGYVADVELDSQRRRLTGRGA